MGVVSVAGPGVSCLGNLLSGPGSPPPHPLFFPFPGLRPLWGYPAPIPRPLAALVACRGERLAGLALAEALEDADRKDGEGAGLFLGGGSAFLPEGEARYLGIPLEARGPVDAATFVSHPPGSLAPLLATRFGVTGPVRTTATACAAGLHSLGQAFRSVRARRVPWAIAGGVEVLGILTLSGFHSLGVLAETSLLPFDARRQGTLLGEGAAFLILEPEEVARARGRRPLGFIRGFSSGTEAWHLTGPAPDGAVAAQVMREAVSDGGFSMKDVGWVKAHGNGTIASDHAEATAIQLAFANLSSPPVVTSLKARIGHTLGASGAVETVAALRLMRQEVLPPSWGLTEPDPRLPFLPRAESEGFFPTPRLALINAFAFGGNDASLLLQGPP